MKISARNIIKGKVASVDEGKVVANVKVAVENPEMLTAVITKESVKDLGLKEGEEVFLIIKSTEVMVGKK
ncbi:TOBE domain-containing protein [Methanobacterium alcaliphilum]|uniref:TOBE domain-containing protein n=1 Tax=Methanobacterium alcaliphilum TaxID=392018 RepID=UPI00200A5209|nr:TOBE domain-containing protein [Methanobacterium alcaliphilum]MCK9151957.1 TOBE domain-containing protein [Methanobacterium alcaliphilum]